MDVLLMLALMGAALYFLMIRPQQKRVKEQKDMMDALAPGARVMTVSGILGTVKHVGQNQVILEVSPGVELTVVKAALSTQSVVDEFEYADEAADRSDGESVDDSVEAIETEGDLEPTEFDLTPSAEEDQPADKTRN